MSKWEQYQAEGLDKQRAAQEAAKKAGGEKPKKIEFGSPAHLQALKDIFDGSPKEE